MTQTQILGWLAKYRIAPFGAKRDDLRAGMLAFWQVSSTVVEAPEDHSPQKYMLKFDDGPPKSEADQIFERIQNRMAGVE